MNVVSPISKVWRSVLAENKAGRLMTRLVLQRHLSTSPEIIANSNSDLPRPVIDRRNRLYKRYSNTPVNQEENQKKQEEEKTLSISSLLEDFASRQSSDLDLTQLLNSGRNIDEKKLMASAMNLYEDLPIKLARKVLDLDSPLPHGLCSMSSIKEVKSLYEKSFKTLVHLPKPDTIDLERKYTNHIKEIYERHSGVLWKVARGVFQLKSKSNHELARFNLEENFPGVEAFLNNFFCSRLDIRMLIGQHIALHEHIDGWVGLFCLKTSIEEICNSSVRAAQSATYGHYNVCPKVNIKINDENQPELFASIPAIIHHILFELLKNSMRATIDHVGLENSSRCCLPEIDILIGNDGVEIVDRAGGFTSQEELTKAWSYFYTTASENDCKHLFSQLHLSHGRDFNINEQGLPLAGLGFGLPISRIFAEYLGGSLELESIQNGTKAILKLNH